MADPTQGDTDGQYLALLVLALIALIAGLLIHSFIIGVNVTDWWEGRSVTPVDLIVTSLGISRMCAKAAFSLYFFATLSSLDIYILQAIGMVYIFFTHTNFWLTSLLSIVLCIKITNLHTRLFLYLRAIIEQRTGYYIVTSVLFSAFYCFMQLSMVFTEITKVKIYNETMNDISIYDLHRHAIYIYTIGSSIPLLFCCSSSGLLFTSLYHHTTKMKMSSNLSINLETYYSAMRFVSVTFIYNIIYSVGHSACIIYFCLYFRDLLWLHIVLGFLPVLHSSYLIYRTAKLRTQMSKVIQNVIYFLFQRKDTETRENIEVSAL